MCGAVRFMRFSYYKTANCTAPCGVMRCGVVMLFYRRFWCGFCHFYRLCSLVNTLNPRYEMKMHISDTLYIYWERERKREREIHTTWTLVLDWSNSSFLSLIHRLGQIHHISMTEISGGPSCFGQSRFQS